MEVWLQHLLVLGSEQVYRTKNQFEQLQVEIRTLHVGSHLWHPVQQIINQYCSEDWRSYVVGKKAVCNYLQGIVLVDALDEVINCLSKDLLEGEWVQQRKNTSQMFKNLFFLFSPKNICSS